MKGRSSGPLSGTRWIFWFVKQFYQKNLLIFQYQLEKPANDEDYEDDDEDDEGCGGGVKKVEEVEDDPIEGQLDILFI